jgi:hypothetical protein
MPAGFFAAAMAQESNGPAYRTADLFVEGCLALRKSAMLPCKSSPYLGIGDDLRLA